MSTSAPELNLSCKHGVFFLLHIMSVSLVRHTSDEGDCGAIYQGYKANCPQDASDGPDRLDRWLQSLRYYDTGQLKSCYLSRLEYRDRCSQLFDIGHFLPLLEIIRILQERNEVVPRRILTPLVSRDLRASMVSGVEGGRIWVETWFVSNALLKHMDEVSPGSVWLAMRAICSYHGYANGSGIRQPAVVTMVEDDLERLLLGKKPLMQVVFEQYRNAAALFAALIVVTTEFEPSGRYRKYSAVIQEGPFGVLQISSEVLTLVRYPVLNRMYEWDTFVREQTIPGILEQPITAVHKWNDLWSSDLAARYSSRAARVPAGQG